MASDDANKKLWTWESAVVDHVRIVLRIPAMLLSTAILSAEEMEAVESALSDVNDCNISKVYRRHAARMVDMNSSRGANLRLFKEYGASFGNTDGTGRGIQVVFNNIASSTGQASKASAAQSIAFLQMWMDLVGNTILGFLKGSMTGNGRSEQNIIFEGIFTLYYLVPYIMLVILAAIMPAVQNRGLYKLFHIVKVLIAASFIIPFGVLGIISLPIYFLTGREEMISASPLPSRGLYRAIPDGEAFDSNEGNFVAATATATAGNDDNADIEQNIEDESTIEGSINVDDDASADGGRFRVYLEKPSQDFKVGIRFGSNREGQVMITNMRKGSIAETSALQIGDAIHSINELSIDSCTPRVAASTLMGASGTVVLMVSRGGGTVVDDEATV
eukprot:CAMPEP_0194075200 /NCGR_PEP_ID=MMETSP0149-20130528/2223_1 /TAXON_ID=122233 /ORGANISM="Chaetoceros debilis, Strain MM31A-1" /LENGTH=388 /DNA_ID=CAMNT_0038755589 /DNA_START=155 /DNA_END=1321 /DNA_ORIENTATION=-